MVFSMVEFACKSIDLKQIVCCGLGISRAEYALLERLAGKESFTVADAAGVLEVDRTAVQKSLQRLLERGLVLRRQLNLEKGGYVFVYRVADRKSLREQLKKTVRSWASSAEKELEKW